MQRDESRQESKYKWIGIIAGAILLPGLGVPITMHLEDYYDVSYVSSAVSAVWNWLAANFVWLGHPVGFPLWAILVVGLGVLIIVAILLWSLNSAANKANDLQAKLTEIENPTVPPLPRLSDTEHAVVMTIAGFLENDHFPEERDVRSHLGLTPLTMQSALDGLYDKCLVEDQRDTNFNDFIDLTQKGRAYALHPDSLCR